MGYAPTIGPMREGESRYRDLPMLTLCGHCRRPIPPLSVLSVAEGGRYHSPLCDQCATTLVSDKGRSDA